MSRSSDRDNGSQISKIAARKNRPEESSKRPVSTEAARQAPAYVGMKLIPWGEVWKSLRTARFRGNGEMIEVFYDTLFKEAVFDDRGAWSLERRNLH
jgi:hypothetical protein